MTIRIATPLSRSRPTDRVRAGGGAKPPAEARASGSEATGVLARSIRSQAPARRSAEVVGRHPRHEQMVAGAARRVMAARPLSCPRVRPAVAVVVPFAGAQAELDALRAQLRALALEPGDTLVIVDNRPDSAATQAGDGVVSAPERRSSYHARNRGTAQGSAPWVLFLDADVLAPPDLVDRYFDQPPDDRTAVLAGAIRDVPPSEGGRIARRYAHLSRPLADDNTWRPGFAYAQTANAMVRRS